MRSVPAMTRIDFHSNPDSPLDYVCRLVRKAYLSGHKVVLVCDDEAYSASLDDALWNNQPSDFLPHCSSISPEASDTPIILATPNDDTPHHDVMINLARATPTFFSRFERLIEVVAAAPEDVTAGRERWAFYRARGYQLTHHDAAAKRA
jgi:DNA polymerase-3 subunit chi